ncbi:UbiA family prenyltransferase [Streptomyces johnsoniae]|uniref:UbiA family prenyltransferase n=1 Tax=Streptomyces johnsoniae TaxID=3075532 RepID=A0ABU2S6Y5_9ACTN|nr:UbiA family prenyltransferase [Streptomyces sp. DSM 41886]MDT0444573.1 UbiA family prenyltransferase [Streptomyces sp. DSM 41886]
MAPRDGETLSEAEPAHRQPAQTWTALPPHELVNLVRRSPGTAGPARTARLLIALSRPRTCTPSLTIFALGYGIVADEVRWQFWLGAFLMLTTGMLANLYNVHTDLDEDSVNMPGRLGLVGEIGWHRYRTTLAIWSAAVVLSSAPLGPGPLGIFLLVLAGSHQYSYRPLRLKAKPVAGLLGFALAGYGPLVFGYAVACTATGQADPPPNPDALLWLLALITLWFLAKGLVKNVPDYDGDKRTGLRTSATVFPTRRAAAVAAGTATVGVHLVAPLFTFLAHGNEGAGSLRWLLLVPAVPFAVLQAIRMTRAVGTHANSVLKQDMWFTFLFIALVLALSAPAAVTAPALAATALLMVAVDALRVDSRENNLTRTTTG